MTDAKQLVKKYLDQMNIMQLATSVGDLPWVCNLHFYADNEANLYWISKPDRRHSLEINDNPNAAAAILVHENTPEENYVIGISIAGRAEPIKGLPPPEVTHAFMKKHGHKSSLADEIASGENSHQFYRLTARTIVLFDSKNFPEQPRQELK
jgi:uncharacterized protein YhbP (UPF0306 family)